jgi:hypothetical protein
MKASRQESKIILLQRSFQEGVDAFNSYTAGDYEALAVICNAVNLMSESTSLLKAPRTMKTYFAGERYSRYPCLILAEQSIEGDIRDCTLISKRDVVLFFRGHAFHGSDSHQDLRSDIARKKMGMLSRYADEDNSVALIFADGLNFVETPIFALGPDARSQGYPGKIGHPDTGYSPYIQKIHRGDNEIRLGTLEAVTLSIFVDVLDTLNNTNKNRNKVIIASEWHEIPKWRASFCDQDRILISQIMKYYSPRKN